MQFERNGERRRKKADCVGCLLVGSFFFKERDGRAWRLCMGLADRIAAPRRVLLHWRGQRKKEKKKKKKADHRGKRCRVRESRRAWKCLFDDSKSFTRSLGRAVFRIPRKREWPGRRNFHPIVVRLWHKFNEHLETLDDQWYSVVYKGVIYSRDVCSIIFYLINRNRFGLRLPHREKRNVWFRQLKVIVVLPEEPKELRSACWR